MSEGFQAYSSPSRVVCRWCFIQPLIRVGHIEIPSQLRNGDCDRTVIGRLLFIIIAFSFSLSSVGRLCCLSSGLWLWRSTGLSLDSRLTTQCNSIQCNSTLHNELPPYEGIIRDGMSDQMFPKSWHCQIWVDPSASLYYISHLSLGFELLTYTSKYQYQRNHLVGRLTRLPPPPLPLILASCRIWPIKALIYVTRDILTKVRKQFLRVKMLKKCG